MANRPLAAPQTVAQGAVILTIATLATRILGVAYRPITGLLFAPYDGAGGEAGNGLAAVPYQIYWVALSFTAVGLNVGISRLVAERLARGDRQGARQVFRVALGLMAALGLAGAVLLWAGAPLLAALLKAPEAASGFRATAPALLLLTLAAAYRGLFQGFRRMTEGGISQVLEQAGRVGAGILLVWWLAPRSVALGAAGFNLGDVAGALLSLGYLLWVARRAGLAEASLAEAPLAEASAAADRSAIVRAVLRISLPFAIIGAIQPLMGLIDTFVLFPLLAARGGIADVAFGQLTLAGSIAALPAVFSLALYTTLIPSVAAAADAGDRDRVRRLARQALRATGLIALPAQAGLLVLAGPVYRLLYPGGQGGPVLAALSWSVAATMFGQTVSGLLQGLGLIRLSVRHQIVGLALKLPLTLLLVLQFGARGAAYATTASVLTAALLNGRELARRLPGIWPWQAALFKPALAAAAMGGVLWFLRSWASQSRLITLPVVGLGVLLYGLALLAVGGAYWRDLRRIPFLGPRLGRWT
jgi:O-antigen/teichoic acid export membrane protein